MLMKKIILSMQLWKNILFCFLWLTSLSIGSDGNFPIIYLDGTSSSALHEKVTYYKNSFIDLRDDPLVNRNIWGEELYELEFDWKTLAKPLAQNEHITALSLTGQFRMDEWECLYESLCKMTNLRHLDLYHCRIVGDRVREGNYKGYYPSSAKNTEQILENLVNGALVKSLKTLLLNPITPESDNTLFRLCEDLNQTPLTTLGIQGQVITPRIAQQLIETLTQRNRLPRLKGLFLGDCFWKGFKDKTDIADHMERIKKAASKKVIQLTIDERRDTFERRIDWPKNAITMAAITLPALCLLGWFY